MDKNNRTKKCPSIFIYGYYGFGNIGDELLLSACLEGISKWWPNSTFIIRNLTTVSPISKKQFSILESNIEILMNDNKLSKFTRFYKYLLKSYKLIRNCNCFVIGGGTVLHATTSNGSLFLLLCLIIIAKLCHIPVIGIGIGAMDLNTKSSKFLVLLIGSLATYLSVRDLYTKKLIPDFKNLNLTTDLVFSIYDQLSSFTSIPKHHVISISLWSISPSNGDIFISALAQALNLLEIPDLRINLILFQNNHSSTSALSDIQALTNLQRQLSNDIKSNIFRPSSNPAELQEAFSGSSLHIGARYHACILSAINSIPFIGIATEPKISSLSQTFNMPYVETNNLDIKYLQNIITNTMQKRIDQSLLSELKNLSCSNFDWFKKNSCK